MSLRSIRATSLRKVSLQIKPDRDGERDRRAGKLGRRRGKRLRTVQQRQRLLVEDGRAGAVHDAAFDEMALPVEGEENLRDALFAARLRHGRVALVALEHRRELRGP